ncbi:MAG: FkbM family methyltransferase [Actinobacteria bacterium]|nr:FkbM family methyltransferase [Actinomycetota bacterium]MCL6105566.1 FkbM family methyltransferase [Actinomycetota bacterium]
MANSVSNWIRFILIGALNQYTPLKLNIKVLTKKGTTIYCPSYSWWAAYENIACNPYLLNDYSGISSFLDIGANIGAFSLALLERFPLATGIAVEPAPNVVQYLHRNLAANKVDGKVKVIEAGVWKQSEQNCLFSLASASEQSSIVDVESGVPSAGYIKINTISLQELLSLAAEQKGVVDLVKIDIEGAEHEIIEDTPAQSWKIVRNLVMECHPVPAKSVEHLVDLLENAGMALVKQTDPLISPNVNLWFSREK